MAQPIRTAQGQGYGQAKAQADAQRAVPLPDATQWEAPVIPLHEPTARPGQHVMDGADAGPGRNAAQAGVIGADDPTGKDQMLNVLRGIFDKYPLPGLASAIQAWSQAPSWSFDDLMLNGPPTKAGGGMFDPGATLDPSQVNDQRIPTAGGFGITAGLAAAGTVGQVAGDVGSDALFRPDMGDKRNNGWSEDSSDYNQDVTVRDAGNRAEDTGQTDGGGFTGPDTAQPKLRTKGPR